MSDGIVPPHRRNGLSRPYSSTQVVGLVALLASVVEYALFVAPILHPCAIAPVTLVLAWVVGLAVQAAAQTILADPVDLHLCRHWRDMDHNHHNNHQSHDDQEQQQPQQQQPPSQQPNNYPTTALSYNALHNPLHRPKATRGMTWSDYLYWRVNGPRQDQPLPRDEDMKQCWICDTQVADHSMHCKFCNKCVYHFDHHCMWLNTCIGQANYASFFRTLLTLCVMEVMHFTVQLYLVIDIFLDGPTRQRAQSWIFGSTATVTILLFFICFNTVSIFLIGQLLQFHRALQRNNLTTYEYIVKDHQSKRARARLAGDLESRRVVLMAEAEQENQRVTVCRLQWGGVCRQMGWAFCDPLDMPQPVEPDPQAGFAQALGGNSHNGPAVNHKESSSQQKQQQRSTSPSLLLDKNSSIPVDFDKELEDALRDTENSGSNIGGEHPHQLVDLMHEVGLPTTSAAEEERNGTAAIKADRTYNYHGDDGVEVDTNDNILPPVTTTTTKSSSTRWTPQSSAMDHDETMRYPIPDPDDSSYLDGNVEMFDNEPNHKEDDASFDSGCSGRSHRSNRSSGNNHANGHNSSYGERDYTAF